MQKRKYKLVVGKMNKKLQTANECKKTYAVFSSLISSIAECIKNNSIKTGELKFSKENEKLNLKFFNNNAEKGEILVEIVGIESGSLGVPYYSSWDGLFYRLPRNKKKPFVKNGQFVKRGQPIGIVFVNKNEQFVLSAPASGHIYFPEDDKHLERGLPIKICDENDPESSKPIFYLQ